MSFSKDVCVDAWGLSFARRARYLGMDQSLSEGAGPELFDSELVALGREGKDIASMSIYGLGRKENNHESSFSTMRKKYNNLKG